MRPICRRVSYLVVLVLLASLTVGAAAGAPGDEKKQREFHDKAVVVDTHNDTMSGVVDKKTWLPVINIGADTKLDVDIAKLHRGQLDVPFFGAYTAPYFNEAKQVDYTLTNSRLLSLMNALHWTIRKNPETIGLARSVADIDALVKEGKIAAVLSIEGAYSLNNENAIELLRQYYDVGVRAVALTHNYSNDLGEGLSEKYIDNTPSKGGLTDLGKNVVKEMNRLGIIIDVSHLDTRTFDDVLMTSSAPIIASHSGVTALRSHARNLTDEQIKAIAKNGGVVQVVFWKTLIAEGEQVTMKQMVDHIDHVVKLVGVNHVGLGSDFDGAPMLSDLGTCAEMPNITLELFKRGYSRSDINKILGGNTLRVMRNVWHKEGSKYNDVAITPAISTGEVFQNSKPFLAARISCPPVGFVEASLKAVLDGKVYIPQYDKTTQTISLQLKEPLAKNFHVVTFEAKGFDGLVTRETRIFYIE